MRESVVSILTITLFTAATQAGEADARAIVEKAIKAGGGEAKLAKYDSVVMKEKGTYYGMGEGGFPFNSVIHMKRPDHFKMEIAGVFTICLNGDTGWMKSDMGVIDLPKEQLELEKFNHKAGWMMSLLPLKDKAYTLQATGTADVDGMKANIVKVSRKDYPTVELYFDQKTDHLVKSRFGTRSSEQKGKEVTAEYLFSDFKTVDGVTNPHHIVIKHDGKLYVEADVLEMTPAANDAKTFAKPAR